MANGVLTCERKEGQLVVFFFWEQFGRGPLQGGLSLPFVVSSLLFFQVVSRLVP